MPNMKPTASSPDPGVSKNTQDPEGPKEACFSKQQVEIRQMAKRVGLPLFHLKERYVSRQMLEAFDITAGPIDFHTGNLPEKVQPFVRPIPPQKMAQMLERTGSLSLRHDLIKSSGSVSRLDDHHSEATFLGYLMETHLKRHEPGRTKPIIPHGTNWRLFRDESKYLARLYEDHAHWQVKAILRYCIDTPDKGPSASRILDPSKPHSICFLADKSPLVQGQVSTSELNTVVWLAGLNYLDPMYGHHSVVPVTVLSASGRRVRIVQGNVNFPKGTVGLRVSEIIDLERGVDKNWEQYLTLLGWMIAEPIGNTS